MADDPENKGTSLEEAVAEAPSSLDEVKDAIGAEGTIASIRSRISKMRADGEGDAATLVEDEPASPGEEKTPEEKEAEEKAALEAKEKAEKEKGGKKKAKGEEKEFKPKYKDHEAAEKGALEATQLATTKAEEAKAAKEALAEREAEVVDLKKKLEAAQPEKTPEQKAEEVKATREERKAQIAGVIKTATRKAIVAIDDIDQTKTREEQQELATAAWTEALTDALLEAGVSAASLSKAEVEKIYEEKIKASKAEEDAAKAEARKQKVVEDNAHILEEAEKLAAGFGLDMTKGSADYRLFHSLKADLANQKFMEAEEAPPLKDQVEWVYNEVVKLKGGVAATSAEEKEKQRKIQERQSILARGLNKPPDKEETLDKPVSIAEIRRGVTQQARDRQRAGR